VVIFKAENIKLQDGTNRMCQVQCVGCNMFKQGEQWTFGLNLDAKYGSSTAFDLHVLSKQTFKMTRADYEEKITYYKELVNKLKKEKNLE
jgi:hypothetical protein